jgi:hypothetical protein
MHYNFRILGSCLCLIGFMFSCSVDTEKHEITTPILDLKAVGPLFEGSNTATATWEFSLKDLFPKLEETIKIEKAKVKSIQVQTREGMDFPKIGKMVIEMKSKYTDMTKIGLLDDNIQPNKKYTFQVADEQDDLQTAITDERITFIGDFDMLEDEYYDDVIFDLLVTLEIETRK